MLSIKVMIKNIGWGIAGGMARRGVVWPFVLGYSNAIKKVGGEGNGILALSPCRYRGNLELLSKKFRVLKIKDGWQSRINSLFLGEKGLPYDLHYHPTEEIEEKQKQLIIFLKKFLSVLYKHYKINVVVSSAVHNHIDYYWGWSSEEIGTPFVILHRENTLYSKGSIGKYLDKWGRLGKFKGTLIITHNEIARKIMIDCGYAPPEKIKALGCPRMDDYVRKCKGLIEKMEEVT